MNTYNQAKEIEGFSTINIFLYKFSNIIMVLSLVLALILIIFTLVMHYFNPNIWVLVSNIGLTIFSITQFVMLYLINNNSIKKNDLIVIRKYRNGVGTITKTSIKNINNLRFDPKDPVTKINISWSGTITDTTTNSRIIQLTEGRPTNDNLNLQVSESEWDRDIAKLTRAKNVADLAEAELFENSFFGFKWQDIALIMIGLLVIIVLGYLVFASPQAIAKEVIKPMGELIATHLKNSVAITPV